LELLAVTAMMHETLTWIESDRPFYSEWRSANRSPIPAKVQVLSECNAEQAWELLSSGTAILWRGDFFQAKTLLAELGRKCIPPATTGSLLEIFQQQRAFSSQKALLLGRLLISVEAEHRILLDRAPDLKAALEEAYASSPKSYVLSLRELLGIIGAHEWRKKGVMIPALKARIHPHYGVFAPIRSEYLELVLKAPLPSHALAFDIGTGTGVIAAILARRGIHRLVATDVDLRAIACARDNLARLKLLKKVDLLQTDLFPAGQAPLIVCNPPWLPVPASSSLEEAIYDQDSRMLRGFLEKLSEHLTDMGEGWLILSDLAERIGLRKQGELEQFFKKARLAVVERLDTRPNHPKSQTSSDPLFKARSKEIVSLWRLKKW
jgi:methylase of polypeptide subunit release factors